MKLLIPCRPLVRNPVKNKKADSVAFTLTTNNVRFILDKMDLVQKMHEEDYRVEGIVVNGMDAEFALLDEPSKMVLIEKKEVQGVKILASAMNITILPGWFYFSGCPEFSDVTYDSISVHRFLLEGLISKL